jgi:cation:H+ antiporter
MDQSLLLEMGKLLLGIIILVYSGNYLVKGSVAIANHFKISALVIGLTVVAFGTSAPELIVSLTAAVSGHPEMALGNVIGSNIANIAMVLALTVIILPMPVAIQTIKRSWPIMFISGIALYLSMLNGLVTQNEGVIMFVLLILFIISSIKSAKRYAVQVRIPKPDNKHKVWVYLLMVIAASAGLAIGSRFLVIGASEIATVLGISERIIAITVVAFGTSIPELTASVVAAIKKETDISVGNIVGSNIFNVFAVIGITAGIKPIAFSFGEFRIDLYFMIVFYLLLFIFILPMAYLFQKEKGGAKTIVGRYKSLTGGLISRFEGTALFLLYVVYILVILNF